MYGLYIEVQLISYITLKQSRKGVTEMNIRCGNCHELLKDNDVAKVYFWIQYKNPKKRPFKRSLLFRHSPSPSPLSVSKKSFT